MDKSEALTPETRRIHNGLQAVDLQYHAIRHILRVLRPSLGWAAEDML